MAKIVVYDPSHPQVTDAVIEYNSSANTPDYDSEPNKLVNPDLAALEGIVPVQFWKRDGSSVVEMSQGEKDLIAPNEEEHMQLNAANVVLPADMDACITVNRTNGGSPNIDAVIRWNESIDKWQVGVAGSESTISLDGHTHTKSNISDFTEGDYVHTTGAENITGKKRVGQIIVQGSGQSLPPDYATGYGLSVQSSTGYSFLEILNNGGANKGCFFGMSNNNFELWSYQGGDLLFFTDESAGAGTERLRVKGDGTVQIHDLNTGIVIADVNGNLSNATTTDTVKLVAGNVQLENDSAAPGNDKLYGTNGSGVKGWYDQPAGGGGDVTGPSSSTDHSIARFDGTSGKTIQDMDWWTIADNGAMAGVVSAISDGTPVLMLRHNGASFRSFLEMKNSAGTDLFDFRKDGDEHPIFRVRDGSNLIFSINDGAVKIGETTNDTDNNYVLLIDDGVLGIRNASGNTAGFSAPASMTNYTLTLPTAYGSEGQVLTTTAGGVLSWTDKTSGSVGGTSKQMNSWTLLSGTLYYNNFTHNLGTTEVATFLYDTATDREVRPQYTEIIDSNTVRVVVEGNSEDLTCNVVSGSGPAGPQGPAGTGDVSSSANITHQSVVRGDGGGKNVQDSTNGVGSPLCDVTISNECQLNVVSNVNHDYALTIQNMNANGDGFSVRAGENLGDIAFHIADWDDTFQIMEMEADQGYITIGKTYAQTLADNGVVHGVDLQHDGTTSKDFNTQNGTYRKGGYEVIEQPPATDLTGSGTIVTGEIDSSANGIGTPLYMASDGNFDSADADNASTMPCRAIALEAGTGLKKVLLRGFIKNSVWSFTPGQDVYVSTTIGTVSQTVPSGSGDQVQKIGFAWNADTLYFSPGDYTIVEVA